MPSLPTVHPVTLAGHRVMLREFSVADAPAVFGWASDREYVRYMAVDVFASEGEATAFVREIETAARTTPRVEYKLGIVERETDELIGITRLAVRSPHDLRSGEIGYGVRIDRWGRGYGTEAASLILAFGFTDLLLHRIFAQCDPDNVGSRRVMEKIGMQYEGHLRDHGLVRGEWRDSLTYSILEGEWRA